MMSIEADKRFENLGYAPCMPITSTPLEVLILLRVFRKSFGALGGRNTLAKEQRRHIF